MGKGLALVLAKLSTVQGADDWSPVPLTLSGLRDMRLPHSVVDSHISRLVQSDRTQCGADRPLAVTGRGEGLKPSTLRCSFSPQHQIGEFSKPCASKQRTSRRANREMENKSSFFSEFYCAVNTPYSVLRMLYKISDIIY